jgi:hypothetical protein
MRFVQLPPEPSAVGGNSGDREEAILEVTGQQRHVVQEFGRPSLGVQQCFDLRDDLAAPGQERSQQLHMRLERFADHAVSSGSEMGRASDSGTLAPSAGARHRTQNKSLREFRVVGTRVASRGMIEARSQLVR